MKEPKVLFVSGSAGLGHVTRDLAIAAALRARWPGLDLVWLAGDPALQVLSEAGENLAPECEQYAGETHLAEKFADDFGLRLTSPSLLLSKPITLLRQLAALRREQKSNLALFQRLAGRERPDLIIGDETYDLMLGLAARPALKPAPFVLIGDFVGIDPVSRSPLEWLSVHVMSWWGYGLVKRLPRFCDRVLLVGEEEDVADRPLGLFLPNRRRLAARLLTCIGYVLPFQPADYLDRVAVRQRLGYGREPLLICAIGGTSIGKPLLELCGRAYPWLRKALPNLRMVAVAGPRLDPASVELPAGVDRRGYVHRLYEHLAASDLAIVQGGGTTTLELTALRRPFIYFPLAGHFEQRIHVAGRIERHGAGLRMEFRETTPESLAEAVRSHIGVDVSYPAIPADGAERAAALLSGLLMTGDQSGVSYPDRNGPSVRPLIVRGQGGFQSRSG
jgi:UDP:flavonoid glycosyltransferase YjiC (YdhE family)